MKFWWLIAVMGIVGWLLIALGSHWAIEVLKANGVKGL